MSAGYSTGTGIGLVHCKVNLRFNYREEASSDVGYTVGMPCAYPMRCREEEKKSI